MSDTQHMLGLTAEVRRQLGHLIQMGTLEEIKGDKVRMHIGDDKDGKKVLSPWLSASSMRGGSREQRFFKKGQNALLFSLTGDPSQAVIIPWSSNDKFQPPDHASKSGQDEETYQLDDLRTRKKKDGYEVWLESGNQQQNEAAKQVPQLKGLLDAAGSASTALNDIGTMLESVGTTPQALIGAFQSNPLIQGLPFVGTMQTLMGNARGAVAQITSLVGSVDPATFLSGLAGQVSAGMFPRQIESALSGIVGQGLPNIQSIMGAIPQLGLDSRALSSIMGNAQNIMSAAPMLQGLSGASVTAAKSNVSVKFKLTKDKGISARIGNVSFVASPQGAKLKSGSHFIEATASGVRVSQLPTVAASTVPDDND